MLLNRVAQSGYPLAGAPDVLHLVHVLTGFAFVDELAAPTVTPLPSRPN